MNQSYMLLCSIAMFTDTLASPPDDEVRMAPMYLHIGSQLLYYPNCHLSFPFGLLRSSSALRFVVVAGLLAAAVSVIAPEAAENAAEFVAATGPLPLVVVESSVRGGLRNQLQR